MPTIFQEKIDKILEHKTRAWRDVIILVTRSLPEEHIAEVGKVLRKLENAGYKASKEKSKFLKTDAEWLGYKITKDGINPLRDKIEAIRKLKSPRNINNIWSFLGSVQNLAKHIPKISEKTALLRELLKKESTWSWEDKHEKAFNEIKSIITCDASTSGLGATLQQIDSQGNRKTIAQASRFVNTAEQKYAIKELELLSAVWSCEHFKYYI